MTDSLNRFILSNDNAKDIEFNGYRIAEVTSRQSEDSARYTSLSLYRTAAGRYICHEQYITQIQSEHNKSKAAVCDTEAEVVDFFGQGWLAKELYDEAVEQDTILITSHRHFVD